MTQNMLLQNILILFTFVALYELIYRWNKKFLYNRLYLIFSVIISTLVPFLSFKVFPYKVIISQIEKPLAKSFPSVETSAIDIVFYIYLVGIFLSLIFFLYKIFRIYILINHTDFENQNNYLIAKDQSTTFSFFKYIFLRNNEDQIVFNHELAHATKYHSLDILFFEIFKSVLWFNPFIYRMKFYAQENHEFEADFVSMNHKNIDRITMAEYLLDYTKKNITGQLFITNNFFSLTKNRINMLAKNKNPRKFTYVMIVPIFLLIFSSSTFKSYPIYETPDGQILQDTVVPGTIITEIDSVVYYDPDTYEEYIKVIKTEIPLDEYLSRIKLSGKNFITIDTIPFYDPKTFDEFLRINKNTIPIEFKTIYGSLNYKQQGAIVKEYGSLETKTIK